MVAGIERALEQPARARRPSGVGRSSRSSERSTARGRAGRGRDPRGGRPLAMEQASSGCRCLRRGSRLGGGDAAQRRARNLRRPSGCELVLDLQRTDAHARRMVAGERQRARHGPVVGAGGREVPRRLRLRIRSGSHLGLLAPPTRRSPMAGSRRSAHVARPPTAKQRPPMESPPAARLEGSYALVEGRHVLQQALVLGAEIELLHDRTTRRRC